jgi:hypothetical protein
MIAKMMLATENATIIAVVKMRKSIVAVNVFEQLKTERDFSSRFFGGRSLDREENSKLCQ